MKDGENQIKDSLIVRKKVIWKFEREDKIMKLSVLIYIYMNIYINKYFKL